MQFLIRILQILIIVVPWVIVFWMLLVCQPVPAGDVQLGPKGYFFLVHLCFLWVHPQLMNPVPRLASSVCEFRDCLLEREEDFLLKEFYQTGVPWVVECLLGCDQNELLYVRVCLGLCFCENILYLGFYGLAAWEGWPSGWPTGH